MKPKIFVTALLSALLALCFLSGSITVKASGESTEQAGAEVSSQDAASKKAVRIIPEVRCDKLPRESFWEITDKKDYSYYTAQSDIMLSFRTSAPVTGVYFMFEKPCSWTLTLPDGTVKKGGRYGMVHEFFALDQPVTEFCADLPANAVITDVCAFTEGTLPDWVQRWNPPCKKADLMVMPTHADDEYLWFGGTIPYYAGEMGYQVQIVYMTNHYGTDFRTHELLDALWKMGVRNYPYINGRFRDKPASKESLNAAKEIYGYDKVLAFQVEMLRRFAPRVVVAHDIEGEYGHGAHKLNAATLLEALKIYDDPSVFPESAEKYGISKVQKCYLHLWPENVITVTWSKMKMSAFGGKSALDAAKEGFACHKSQAVIPFKVRESGVFDCRKFGLAYTTVGNDTPGINDMFENVDWSDTKTPQETVSSAEENQKAVSASDISPSDVSASDGNQAKKGGNSLAPVFMIILSAAVLLSAAAGAFHWLKRKKGVSDETP